MAYMLKRINEGRSVFQTLYNKSLQKDLVLLALRIDSYIPLPLNSKINHILDNASSE